MRIGMIGVGSLGGTLARVLASAGHTLRVANSKGAEAVRAFAEEIGAEPADANGAVEDVEMVILSVPLSAMPGLTRVIARVPEGVPIVETANYYPEFRDERIDAIDQGQTESLWTSETLGRPVIKAFNNMYAHSLGTRGTPGQTSGRLALPVAGDDAAAKLMVMRVIESIDFEPVDAGPLAESWRQQPSTPVYCTDLAAEETRRALACADRDEAVAKRSSLAAQYAELGENPSHEQLVQSNRRTFATSGMLQIGERS